MKANNSAVKFYNNIERITMKWIVQIARILVGGLFIFSGIIKVNDPVGTAIKLEEYFQVFAYDFCSFL